MDEPEGGSSSDMLETPQLMDIAVQFKPILNTLPKTGIDSPILLTTPNNSYFKKRDDSFNLENINLDFDNASLDRGSLT